LIARLKCPTVPNISGEADFRFWRTTAKRDLGAKSSTARQQQFRPTSRADNGSRLSRVGATLAAFALACVLASCTDDGDASVDELLVTADGLLDDLVVELVDEPKVTESKSVRYVTATASIDAEPGSANARLADGLVEVGWTIASSTELDVTASPASEGYQIIAERDGQIASFALFDQIGSRPAPAGQLWVQMSVANPDSRLAWTQTD
jgi:hypothetical protein